MRENITALRLLVTLWLTALVPCAHAKMAISPAHLEVSQVANSMDLSPAEKVARLREIIRKEETFKKDRLFDEICFVPQT